MGNEKDVVLQDAYRDGHMPVRFVKDFCFVRACTKNEYECQLVRIAC